ncbi:unnamed protein product [Pieris brassicae]|uniref:Uncharacterized protein n=1 Tax=Pieris brassicae TaxID=7116 RepID=A0A9P0U0K9_PIEBR|nr:unnamed protein product [Pieris brassicae]
MCECHTAIQRGAERGAKAFIPKTYIRLRPQSTLVTVIKLGWMHWRIKKTPEIVTLVLLFQISGVVWPPPFPPLILRQLIDLF